MATFAIPDHVYAFVRENELVLQDDRLVQAHLLNVTGRLVVEFLADGASLEEVVEWLASVTSTDREIVDDRVRAIVGQLLDLGVLEPRANGAASVNRVHTDAPSFPWYDSGWLERYVATRQTLRRHWPEELEAFEARFAPLHTSSTFATRTVEGVFDDATLAAARRVADDARRAPELHELDRFGRLVAHNVPFFNQLQIDLVDFVGDLVGESVEPAYNFLSLYTRLDGFGPHLDAPTAKWTLDVCLDQSEPWPLSISQVVEWPDDFPPTDGDWEADIVSDPNLHFTEFVHEPGDGVVFSGSSQWHFRAPLPRAGTSDLVFFHYIPLGARDAAATFERLGARPSDHGDG